MSTFERMRYQLSATDHGTAMFDMSHLEHPSQGARVVLILALAALASLTYFLHTQVYSDGFSERALTAYCWLYTAVTVAWIMAKWARPAPRNWLSPDVVFWIMYTMFHIPYVLFYLVGWAEYDSRAFFSPGASNRAMCCVVLCGVGFFIGYELGPLGRPQPAVFAAAHRIPKGLFQFTQLMLLTALAGALFVSVFGAGAVVLSHGHAGLMNLKVYAGAETERWVGITLLSVRLLLGLYIAACVLHYRKVMKGVIIPAMLTGITLFFFLIGSRTQIAVLLLPTLIGYHYYVKPIRLWLGIPLFVVALFTFGALGVARLSHSLSPADLVKAYREHQKQTGFNPFIRALAESGTSIKTVNVACTFIPKEEPYWLGKSLLDSTLMIIPNPFPGLRRHVPPSEWVTYRATGSPSSDRVAGWGSSMAMEAYINFGLLGGMVFTMGIGCVMRRIYDTQLRRPTFTRICLMLISITGLALWCRNYSHHFIRPVAWTLILAWGAWLMFGAAHAYSRQTSPPPRTT